VVDAIVLALELLEGLHRLFEQADDDLAEAIGDGEAEHPTRVLMLLVDGEHVVADALGLLGLIERAIERRLLDGRVELVGRQLLQLVVVHGPTRDYLITGRLAFFFFSGPPVTFRMAHRSGSK
jgi:hypothetical protein